jgi:hypothetical protein
VKGIMASRPKFRRRRKPDLATAMLKVAGELAAIHHVLRELMKELRANRRLKRL